MEKTVTNNEKKLLTTLLLKRYTYSMRSLSQMIDENNLIFGFGALTGRNSKIL